MDNRIITAILGIIVGAMIIFLNITKGHAIGKREISYIVTGALIIFINCHTIYLLISNRNKWKIILERAKNQRL